jgi:predicted NUDIX family phosphoesterase
MGIGGHINPVDERGDALGMETYMAGVEREINEELNIEGGYSQKVVAILNDDSNEVGKVHLGVVHVFDLETNQVSSAEDAIADLQFNSIKELQETIKPSLETWSQFCTEILEQI